MSVEGEGMYPKRILTATILWGFFMVSGAKAWQGKQDNKTIAELALMDDEELAQEMNGACQESGWKSRALKGTEQPMLDIAYYAHHDATEYAEVCVGVGCSVARWRCRPLPD
jgi:hypothetical protein